MSQYKDYTNPTVGNASCTYSKLASVYSGQMAGSHVPSSANYTVPKLCPNNGSGLSYPPRYDTLQHGNQASCGGYFHLNSAYPNATCNTCNAEYVQRPCAGNIHSACTPPSTKEGYRHR